MASEKIRAEMVANVWKAVVRTGDRVADGDTLVILESMKMEIPVIAESDGVVTLAIFEGDVVQEGDLIAIVADKVDEETKAKRDKVAEERKKAAEPK